MGTTKTTTDWIINADPAQSSLAGLMSDIEKYNATVGKSAEASKQAFQKSANATQAFNKELANGTRNYRLIDGEVKKLAPSFAAAFKAQKQFTNPADVKRLEDGIDTLKKKINETKKGLDETGKSGGFFKNILSGIGGQLAGIASIGAIIGIGKQIFDVTAEFQKFEAVLTNTLGSNSAAERAMLMIQDFAAKTPYGVAELTDAYVKFANRGLKLTNTEMRALGDIAASTGKSFDQLTEAALDAFSGENERLKEFGITAQKAGEKTFFTFKGVTTEVKNTSGAIKEYMISLGNVEGVAGSMAAISETLTGKVSNLGDTFDKLFLTLGNQQTGILGGTIELINDLTESIIFLVSTTDQLGKERSAEAVTKYATEITEQFKSIATEAKKAGKDVKEALDMKSFSMENDLKDQLLGAEKRLKGIRAFRSNVATVVSEWTDTTGFERVKNKNTEAALAADVAKIKGQLEAIKDAKKEILKPDTSGIDPEALKAAEKARKEAEKKAAAERKKALADLEKELADLEKQAAAARLNMLDKNSKEYFRQVLASNLKGIDTLRIELIKASKAAGKGGVLGDLQKEQLEILEQGALKEYYDGIAKLQEAHDDKVLDLQKDSDEKQLAQINRKYDKEIAAANRANDFVLAAALEKARGLEVTEVTLQQALKKIKEEEAIAIAQAERGEFITQAEDGFNFEKYKQRVLLDIQIKAAQKSLEALRKSGDEKNKVLIEQHETLLNKLLEDRSEIKGYGQFDLMQMLGVEEKDRKDVEEAFNKMLSTYSNFISSTLDQQVRAADQRVEEKERAIEEKRDEINTELELSKAGFASSVELKRQELADLKKQRQAALADQRKAVQAQQAFETMQQTVGLITSSVDIIKGFSKIPVIGLPLGIAAVATMFGAFVAMKSKAASLSKTSATQYEKGGWIKGNRHSAGGEKYYGGDGSVKELEDGEYVTRRTAAAKNAAWLEAINSMDENRMNELAFGRLLKGTGVIPAKDLPKKVKRLAEKSSELKQRQNSYDYRRLEAKLDKIAKNTGKPERIETETQTIIKTGNFTRIINKKPRG